MEPGDEVVLPAGTGELAIAGAAIAALAGLAAVARARLRERVSQAPPGSGRLAPERLVEHQLATHALAWLVTEIEAARRLAVWAAGAGGELERRIAAAYAGELVGAIRGGVDLGPCESVRLGELGLEAGEVERALGGAIDAWAREAASGGAIAALAPAARAAGSFGERDAGDAALAAMRAEIRRFAEAEVRPIAADIHRRDALIPLASIERLSGLGVFGLTTPVEHGGQGLGKLALCVVTEELARVSLAVASLGTRAEIAAELILHGGTDAQRRAWLPGIAAGRVLPTAVFSEPDAGSDLASVRTRAERLPAGGWAIHGQKTWATHAARADLMALLVRTGPPGSGHAGLSVFLAQKRRAPEPSAGAGGDFPDAGLAGTEIPVIGYRGLKEYELSFDGFRLGDEALLGGEEGKGFKQLMATMESARIQTAARAVGVAQAALEAAMRYAHERVQFGAPIASFPRIARKLGRMIARVAAARQLTFFAARAKDSGRRSDLEAGMAKLLATRAAWECADACVQIHGGNGYAEEFEASRLLLDARVLSIFEGTNEVLAGVVARRLLEG